jgi:hypothetical protein
MQLFQNQSEAEQLDSVSLSSSFGCRLPACRAAAGRLPCVSSRMIGFGREQQKWLAGCSF